MADDPNEKTEQTPLDLIAATLRDDEPGVDARARADIDADRDPAVDAGAAAGAASGFRAVSASSHVSAQAGTGTAGGPVGNDSGTGNGTGNGTGTGDLTAGSDDDGTASALPAPPTVKAESPASGASSTRVSPAASSSSTRVIPVIPPGPDLGYILTRRDRTAIKFIDVAIKLGTPEFQQHYRPVTDELFTHHFIDPTAKPAFVPPAMLSVQQLTGDSDPLEIIRSHIGLVVDDRQSRDKARLEAQTQLEEAERRLQALQEYSNGLESDLAATNERLRLAENTIVDVTGQRDSQVASLTDQLARETGDLRSQNAADANRQQREHADAVALLAVQHAAAIDAANTDHNSALADLHGLHADQVTGLRSEIAAQIATTEGVTRQLKEARLQTGSLTAQRDRAIAEGSEWRNRLQQLLAAVAETIGIDDWSMENAPDERLVEFVAQSHLSLSSELDQAKATLDEIEEVATAQLVDDSETGDYAIGANDASVLVLNALYGGAADGGDDANGDEPGDAGSENDASERDADTDVGAGSGTRRTVDESARTVGFGVGFGSSATGDTRDDGASAGIADSADDAGDSAGESAGVVDIDSLDVDDIGSDDYAADDVDADAPIEIDAVDADNLDADNLGDEELADVEEADRESEAERRGEVDAEFEQLDGGENGTAARNASAGEGGTAGVTDVTGAGGDGGSAARSPRAS